MTPWPQPVTSLTNSKSSTPYRPRPKGYDVLFYGTSVSSAKRSETRPYGGLDLPISQSWPNGYRVTELLPTYQGLNVAFPYLKDDVNRKLHQRIKNQKVNLAQTLAEFRQTASMFEDSGTRVLRAIRAARRLNVYGVLTALVGSDTTRYPKRWKDVAKTPTRSLAETTLAFNFGVKPLISDLNGSIDELIQAYQIAPLVRRVSATATAHDSRKTLYVHNGVYSVYDVSWEGTCTTALKAVVWLQYEREQPGVVLSRFGFRNAAALAWELTPLSVFIDYFVNVGEALQNFDTLTGVGRLGVHYSYQTTSTGTAEYKPRNNTGQRVGGVALLVDKNSQRVFTTQLDFPRIRGNTPNFVQTLNLLSFARLKLFR